MYPLINSVVECEMMIASIEGRYCSINLTTSASEPDQDGSAKIRCSLSNVRSETLNERSFSPGDSRENVNITKLW